MDGYTTNDYLYDDSSLVQYQLYGIRFPWQKRRTASGALGGNFALSADQQLQTVLNKLKFTDGLVDAAERLLATVEDANNDMPVVQDLSGDELYDVGVLTASNQRLKEEQMQHFKSNIEQKNTELLQIDYNILRLQLQLNKCATAIRSLVQTRFEKQKEADSNHIWTSSARLLPLDVIIAILQYARETGMRSSSPMKLAHICSSWRKAALICSSLWTELNIDCIPTESPRSLILDDSPPGSPRVVTPRPQPNVKWFITTWFSRATPTVPLLFSLSLHFEALDPEFGRGLAEGILPFAHRISKLNVEFNGSWLQDYWDSQGLEVLKPFLTLPGGTFPLLNDLEWRDNVRRQFDKRPADEVIPQITVFDRSPLRHLRLRPKPWLFNRTRILILPWQNLTHLKIEQTITTHGFVDIIFQCQDLQQVHFEDVFSYAMDDPVVIPVERPVIFTNLTDWKLKIHGPGLFMHHTANFLSMIKLPVVETLVLITESYGSNSSHLPFHALCPLRPPEFGTLFYPPLRRLLLVDCDITLVQLVDVLSACPLLEKLSLSLHSHIEPTNLLNALSEMIDMGSGALSHLVSLAFAFKAPRRRIEPIDTNNELTAVLAAFRDLIYSFRSMAAESHSQQSPMSELILCVINTYPGSSDVLHVDEDILDAYLKEIIGLDVDEQLGIKLLVKLVAYFGDCREFFAITDPARSS